MSKDPAVHLTVSTEGHFFERDPGATLYTNIGKMLDELAVWQEEEVRSAIAGHAGEMPYYSGWSWARTIGRRRSGRTGKHWAVSAVVSANTEGGDPRVGMLDKRDAIRTKAAAATIERRWHPYRRVKSATYRARPILTADLTKGLE